MTGEDGPGGASPARGGRRGRSLADGGTPPGHAGPATPPDLFCPDCGATYPAGPDEPWRCSCGHPLELAWEPDLPADPPTPDRDRGLWALPGTVPVARAVTLGEGWTPLVDAPAFDAAFKLEYVFPTGSFKDRGAATTLSRAASLGVERVVEDSSGNAGAAVATYAARAGIDAEIFVPAGVKPAKRAAIERAGATPVPVEGSRQDVTDACVSEVEGAAPRAADDASGQSPRAEGGDAWYASHAWNPAFFAGTATFAFEVAAQREWSAPDAVVLPLGHGTLFLGAYRGFRLLADAGWVDSVPRLLGAQAAGTAPIVAELHGAAAAAGANDDADGIQIADPVRKAEILAAVEETDGDAVAVDAADTRETLARMRRHGFDTEPTCATAPAALETYRERGTLAPDADVVVPLTGSGLKDPP
jgi:threonine synthase